MGYTSAAPAVYWGTRGEHGARCLHHTMTHIETTDRRIRALAAHLGCDSAEIQSGTISRVLFSHDSRDYFVFTADEADARAAEYIRETLWAFRPEFLADYVVDGIDATALRAIIGDRCEDANDAVLALVEAGLGLDRLIAGAIATDGRAHFMGAYDDEERDADGFYIYRIN